MPKQRPGNVYHFFLKIAADGSIPDHYELLGIPRFTTDPVVFKRAAVARSTELCGWDNSDYHVWSNELLDEVVAALIVLESPTDKAEYDRDLRQTLEHASAPPAIPLADTTTSPAVLDFIPADPQDVGSLLEQIAQQETSNYLTSQATTATRAPLPKWVRWGAAGFAVVLLAGVVWFITSKSANSKTAEVAGEKPSSDEQPMLTTTDEPSNDSVTDRPQFVVGESIDLLKQIEVSRDVVVGYWRFE